MKEVFVQETNAELFMFGSIIYVLWRVGKNWYLTGRNIQLKRVGQKGLQRTIYKKRKKCNYIRPVHVTKRSVQLPT